ncbi:hypothetical protein D3C72_1797440 [compost metagenome]
MPVIGRLDGLDDRVIDRDYHAVQPRADLRAPPVIDRPVAVGHDVGCLLAHVQPGIVRHVGEDGAHALGEAWGILEARLLHVRTGNIGLEGLL